MIFKTFKQVFQKYKSYTTINIFGLSVGFALLMIIVLVLHFDLSYDKHWEKSSDIFRIDSKFLQENTSDQLALSSKLLPPRIMEVIPEIEGYARFSRPRKRSVKIGERLFSEERLLYSDSESLELFTLKILEGPSEGLLKAPNELIISDQLAKKWFDENEPIINEVILIGDNFFTIRAIYQSLPKNSHLYFDALMSYETILGEYEDYESFELDQNIWLPDAYCYIQLNVPRNPEAVQKKIEDYIDINIRPAIAALGSNEELRPILVNLEDTHFYTGSEFDQDKGNIAFVKATVITGIVILLIISINYANLSMAILVQRHKELCMRRLLGASRLQIIGQIVLESIISVLISLVIALGWVYLFVLLIPIEDLIGRPIDLIGLFVLDNLLYWVPGILIIALLSSLYPAYLFSQANIVEMDNRRKTAQTFTNIMIGVQFVASFMVISSMFLMKSQLNMLLNFDLGISEEQIVSIELGNRSTNDEVQLLRTQLFNEPGVLKITDAVVRQDNLIGTYNINTEIESEDGSRIETVFSAGFVGFDFCDVFGIEVVEGRDFRSGQLERQSVLVNKKFANEFYQGDALGKPIHFRNVTYTIIGVVENFHYHSLRDELQALAIFPRNVFNDGVDVPIETSFQIRIDQINQNHTLDHIKDVFADRYPNYPFGYKYVSDKITSFYEEDQNDASLTAILGFSAIFIAIFGLVGLVSFEINQRLKELSIRKVLGADPKSLFYTITKKQLFVLLLTCLISVPATYMFIKDWLNDFSISINLSISILFATVATFIIVLFLVLAAMTFKFIEIMRINPSESLRHE